MRISSLAPGPRSRRARSLGPAFLCACVVLGLPLRVVPVAAQPVRKAEGGPGSKPVSWKELNAVKAKVQKLGAQGQVEQALAQLESYLRAHADPKQFSLADGQWGMLTGIAVSLIKELDEETQLAQYERILQDFRAVRPYAAMAASQRTLFLLWKRKDPQGAEKSAREALQTLGEPPPRTYHSGALYLNLGQALRQQGKTEEARQFGVRAVYVFPNLLENKEFGKLLFESAKSEKDWDGMLSAAKLVYCLCDFTEEPLSDATRLVIEALTLKGGPGLAAQFVKAQDSPDTENPLKDVPLPDLAPPEGLVAQPVTETGQRPILLEAAADDLHARLNAQLALGDHTGAIGDALDEMRAATGKKKEDMAQALRDVARCFKAKDLNLIRANQFLEFQRTGQGENPLPTF